MKRVLTVAVALIVAVAMTGCAAPVDRSGEVWNTEWCQPVLTTDDAGNRWLVYTSPQGNIMGVVTATGECAIGGTGKHIDLATRAMIEETRKYVEMIEEERKYRDGAREKAIRAK